MEMEEMDLREYWEILVKKKQLILAVFFVTVLAVTIYSLVATPIYEASTTVIVREGGSDAEAILFDGIATLGKNTAQNYIQIMKSRTVLEQVAAELGREELTPTALDKAITIQPIQGSDVLKISMQSPEPTLAQAVVNKLADVFISWNLDYRQNDRKAARLFIESQLETVEQDLRLAEERLQNFKEEQGVLAPAQETTAVVGQLASLHSNLTELAISKQEIDERIRQVRANLAEQDETLISSTTIADNRLVTEYRSRLADLEIKLSSAREKYTERHPEILSLQAEIEDVRRKLTEEVERVVGTETRTLNTIYQQLYGTLINLEVEANALAAREAALLAIIDEREKDLSHLPAQELELARLTRDAKVLEELYILLRTRREEARITEAMQTADVQIIDRATLPERPVKPRVKLNIAIGGVLGVFLGVGLAFLVEFLDNTLKTKEEVEQVLGLPVLGEIPDLNGAQKAKEKRSLLRKGRGLGA